MKTKIALLKWKMDRVDGGEKVAVSLSNALANDYEVHLISLNSGLSQVFDLSERVRFHSLGQGKKRVRDGLFQTVSDLRAYLKANQIQLVFSIGVTTNIFLILSSLFSKRKKIVCEHINTQYRDPGKMYLFQRWFGAKFADKIITLTKEDQESYVKMYGLNPKKVETIYNWIEEKEGQTDLLAKRIITVGRFNRQKGYDLLSQVAGKVLKRHKDWHWDIIGSGDESIKRQFIADLTADKVVNQVTFSANVKGTENIYPGHSIYVMTSYYEGLPLVLLEAKQYGLPIVSFKCPTGPSDIVEDGVNGFLVDCYDTEKLAEKLEKLMLSKDLRESFSRQAKRGVEKFSKEKIVDQWRKLIEELVGG